MTDRLHGDESDAHDELLKMSDEAFQDRIAALDQAFASQSAAFFFNSQDGSHTIDLFRMDGTGVSDDDEYQLLRDFARDLDQLVIFAFSDAPDSVAHEWGEVHGEGLGDMAVHRASVMVDKMPNALRAWEFRQSAPGRILGDLSSVIVFAGSHGICAQIRLDSFIPVGPRAIPSGSSRQFLDAMVTKNDIQYLIAQLEHLSHLLPDFDALEEDDS